MIPVRVLSVRFLPNADPALRRALELPAELPSLGFLTTDCDDATYIALDEATKAAPVTVAYGRSFYAGAANASTSLAGEVLGILAGPTPAEVRSGMDAALSALKGLGFRQTAADPGVIYLAHTVSSAGSYLSGLAHMPPGGALAYLIAPPGEAVAGLDAALKAAQTELRAFFPPPTETNFAGGLLAGSRSACAAAAAAFAQTVEEAAARPIN